MEQGPIGNDSGLPLGGVWELTLVMVLIASWVLYRFVAPKSWREWSRAGLVQAFIIALYAEMYGFPLTIYFLTGWLGLRIPWLHENGHLWVSLFGWGPLAISIEMMLGYLLVFSGLSLLIEGWREVYRARKQQRLATTGLYGIVRHPQYTGIFLAILGQVIHWPTIPTVLLAPLIVWAYYRLARREERVLLEQWGVDYALYRQQAPMFLPRGGAWRYLLFPRLARRRGERQTPADLLPPVRQPTEVEP